MSTLQCVRAWVRGCVSGFAAIRCDTLRWGQIGGPDTLCGVFSDDVDYRAAETEGCRNEKAVSFTVAGGLPACCCQHGCRCSWSCSLSA